jgi:carbonic anhydrase
MTAPTLLDAVVAAANARASGDRGARAALPPGQVPFVITCMDPRLAGVLLPALGLEGVPVPQAKFAGGLVRMGEPAAARSVLSAAIFNMATEVLVIGHTDCRMGKTSSMEIRDGVRRLGVPPSAMEAQDPAAWLGAFTSERSAVEQSVAALRADPHIPPRMPVHGLLYRLDGGGVEVVVSGYAASTGAAPARPAPGPAPAFSTGGYAPGPVSFGSAAPPPAFTMPGPPPSIGPGASPTPSFSAPPPPPFATPPSLVPAGLAPPSFPSAPEMDAIQPGEVHTAPEPVPDLESKADRKKKRKRGSGSPFDSAREVLDRLRREE